MRRVCLDEGLLSFWLFVRMLSGARAEQQTNTKQQMPLNIAASNDHQRQTPWPNTRSKLSTTSTRLARTSKLLHPNPKQSPVSSSPHPSGAYTSNKAGLTVKIDVSSSGLGALRGFKLQGFGPSLRFGDRASTSDSIALQVWTMSTSSSASSRS